jgi:hypothetical protein
LRVNWLTRIGSVAQYHARVESRESESRSFTMTLIATTLLVVGFVAYARWSVPTAQTTRADLIVQRQPQLNSARNSHDSTPLAKPPFIAIVYECQGVDQRVFSDHPCSDDARVREVIAPNGMRAARVAKAARAAVNRTPLDLSIANTGSAEPSSRRKDSLCKSIDEQIDNINARMRQPYSAAEGEWYRERLRLLDDRRWDEKCRIR